VSAFSPPIRKEEKRGGGGCFTIRSRSLRLNQRKGERGGGGKGEQGGLKKPQGLRCFFSLEKKKKEGGKKKIRFFNRHDLEKKKKEKRKRRKKKVWCKTNRFASEKKKKKKKKKKKGGDTKRNPGACNFAPKGKTKGRKRKGACGLLPYITSFGRKFPRKRKTVNFQRTLSFPSFPPSLCRRGGKKKKKKRGKKGGEMGPRCGSVRSPFSPC